MYIWGEPLLEIIPNVPVRAPSSCQASAKTCKGSSLWRTEPTVIRERDLWPCCSRWSGGPRFACVFWSQSPGPAVKCPASSVGGGWRASSTATTRDYTESLRGLNPVRSLRPADASECKTQRIRRAFIKQIIICCFVLIYFTSHIYICIYICTTKKRFLLKAHRTLCYHRQNKNCSSAILGIMIKEMKHIY